MPPENSKQDKTTAKPKEEIEEIADEVSSKDGDLDELMDEIDILLESNAEEFVASYVQKGGE